ncbi:MAG: hypothetical protein ABGX83_06450 [Nitrospira sp.]|nr:hypothetical protein [Candidatus Manganitrophaceae bacterium]HIL34409.1 hypothetical protein [Candidatus Manganitrophaceae bacterium]
MSTNADLSESGPLLSEPYCEIRTRLIQEGLYRVPSPGEDSSNPALDEGNRHWRIASGPYWITPEELAFLESLGNHLLSFYEAANRLYLDSTHGRLPSWVAGYLDRGKPEAVIEYGGMNRFKQDLPGIIRPDLIQTEKGMIATELDSVPGGIGMTGGLVAVYASLIRKGALIGDREGMVQGFERMIRSLSNKKDLVLAIVVSKESEAYRPEMIWLGKALRARGLSTAVIGPEEIIFTEEGLWLNLDGKRKQIDILYRFFELFDLKNIPKAELILYAAKKKRVIMTPPPKAQLEEKNLFALFHHPVLKTFWQRHLGEGCYAFLGTLFPKTWIIDPTVLPPHAVIPDLTLGDRPVTDFRQMGDATQKQRRFVIKPSGFSELAWGSRGVSIGHDLSEEEWRKAIDRAMENFSRTPYLIQAFHKGKKVVVEYYDFEKECLVEMEGRVRLSPYYFVEGKKACLGGVLATVCSLEKKIIHGMVDAVMAPCAVSAL